MSRALRRHYHLEGEGGALALLHLTRAQLTRAKLPEARTMLRQALAAYGMHGWVVAREDGDGVTLARRDEAANLRLTRCQRPECMSPAGTERTGDVRMGEEREGQEGRPDQEIVQAREQAARLDEQADLEASLGAFEFVALVRGGAVVYGRYPSRAAALADMAREVADYLDGDQWHEAEVVDRPDEDGQPVHRVTLRAEWDAKITFVVRVAAGT